MRDATPERWQRWRIALAAPIATAAPVLTRVDRLRMPQPVPVPAGTGRDEQPGPDGIRHGLVARIRREIAAGTYDTEERWLVAEAELLRRIEARM